jgi:glycosyltransferase involved in cell wall biosynthesis
VQAGQDADTALRGLNYIPDATYSTAPSRFLQSLPFVSRLLQYDFIVAQDNLLLGYAVSVCARLFQLKTRWIYVAMNSSVLMRRHAVHPVRLLLLKKFWASYSRIICLSSEQREDFIRLGIARERLAFIPFGVDAHFFQPTDVSHEENLIVSVGRDAGRDYRTLFQAAERTDHPFVVVATHKNIPPGLSVPANVSVLYDRSFTEIRDLYQRARLVVIASKDVYLLEGSDCSGQTVILDALAARKAVIATYRSWIADYFIPGEDLVVVEPGDPESLAQAINSLWNDVEKRKCLAASGHAKVVARYTTKNFAEALLKLMDSVVAQNRIS